jgi:2-isopropylmalate synthase
MTQGKTAVEILDTTLRDGAQGEGITFSVQDKFAVIRALDELGVAWIEAGNPGSNPKDAELFREARGLALKHARLCAFGPTRRPAAKAENDPHLRGLLDAETEAVTVFGKSWNLHVSGVLRVSLEENLAMISETVAFFRKAGRGVFFDAEHFFDGFRENPDYALASIRAAFDAGAGRIVLCDTNGGSFPEEIGAGVKAAAEHLGNIERVLAGTAARRPSGGSTVFTGGGAEARSAGWSGGGPDGTGGGEGVEVWKQAPLLGIHAHNDMGLAVAGTIAAIRAGCVHVQGTLAGFGERCGNTNLSALIPTLELKLGLRCLPEGALARISEITRRVAETANVRVPAAAPYVGYSAFSHKGGMHSDGVLKVSRSFEHVDPGLVGNSRHLLMSEIGGRAAIAERIKKIVPPDGVSITKEHPVTAALAEKLKTMDASGWAFEGADASFELLVRRELAAQEERPGPYRPLFRILAYRVLSEHPAGESIACSHAWTKVWVDGQNEIAAAEGDGPVHALDGALRRALIRFYPQLARVRLTDFKVRVIDGAAATAAKVRVLIESTDGPHTWVTVGVSEDIIDASRAALVDSIEYKLIRDAEAVREIPVQAD